MTYPQLAFHSAPHAGIDGPATVGRVIPHYVKGLPRLNPLVDCKPVPCCESRVNVAHDIPLNLGEGIIHDEARTQEAVSQPDANDSSWLFSSPVHGGVVGNEESPVGAWDVLEEVVNPFDFATGRLKLLYDRQRDAIVDIEVNSPTFVGFIIQYEKTGSKYGAEDNDAQSLTWKVHI